MTTMLWLKYALIANVVAALTALVFMANRRVLRDYYALAIFLLIDAIECSISVSLLYYRKNLGLSKMAAYNFYFYSHMAAFLLEYAVLLVIIYSVFQTLIRPFEGLHR